MTPAERVKRRVYLEERERVWGEGVVGPEAINEAVRRTAKRLDVPASTIFPVIVGQK